MPVDGLCLVGFMEEQQGIQYLQSRCIPASPDPVSLSAEWQAARSRIGDPIPNAGHPSIANLTIEHDQYLQQLRSAAWQAGLYLPTSPWTVKIVGIRELLAFQFHVDMVRPNQYCASVTAQPSLAELLPMCLPLQPTPISYNTAPNATATSIALTARDINFRIMQANFDNGIATVVMGGGLPHVQVLRLNGKCYLANGFHRVAGLHMRGVDRVPCLFRDVANAAELGINPGTFSLPLLESENPPTCSHFCEERAHRVALKKVTRMIHLAWSEHVLFDE